MVSTMSMSRPSREAAIIVRAVTVIIGTVVGRHEVSLALSAAVSSFRA